MIKRLAHIALGLVLLTGMILLLSFAVDQNRQTSCRNFIIHIDRSCGQDFLTEEYIRRAVYERFDTIEGKILNPGKLNQIKQMISANPYVERSAVYRTINNDLRIDIHQRQPLLRVVNTRNETFYIDRLGRLLPVSNRYTPRVMVAGGHIRTHYSPNIRLAENLPDSLMVSGEKTLRELFHLAEYISQDPFWRAMIDQITVTARGEFELIPSNGAHVIELGDSMNLEEKFNKLRVFYRYGLTETGWDHYRRINLRFNNQVVCSK